ncbi:DivIVA domain-containing protein [Desulforhopalus singaporensis]|uniref:DivIVA domain-containing protein n=1 Tax=Desulforhopalus singaporensis TaxID=91360 RepID=A0A1H0JU39_9BACT|nr:DivIVA domain-containing protein [Desulforhopalus singaporensis]SDO47236.1 DivIVA domain-containing protein [Desulforhopalus singaporensis]
MLTPQAIKDQEFQTKFRGYDTIEVKAYLELLADDYFELAELNRNLEEQLETLHVEREELQADNGALQEELRAHLATSVGSESEIAQERDAKEKELATLKEKLERVKQENQTLAQENRDYQQSNEKLKEDVERAERETAREKTETEKLRSRLELLVERNEELKQEGADFKTTILAAQNFANNLKATTEENARKLMEEAKAEVEGFKESAQAELHRLPIEIEELEQKKSQVRRELQELLHSYLAALDLDGEAAEEPVASRN